MNEPIETSSAVGLTARKRRPLDQHAYIELCESMLRIAIVTAAAKQETAPLVRTRTINWRDKASNLLDAAGCAELTEALRMLAAEERLVGCEVTFAIGGAYCANRVSAGTIAEVDEQLAGVRSRSQHYLSLGPGLKTAAIARTPIDARHEQAVATIASEHVIEALAAATEEAGLKLVSIESSLVALARLHHALEPGVDHADLLAHVDDHGFELGVCWEGQLWMEHRPAPGAEKLDVGKEVQTHLRRIVRHCSRQHGLPEIDQQTVWLVGDFCMLQAASAGLEKLSVRHMPIERASQYWTPETKDTLSHGSAVAIGLAAGDLPDFQSPTPNLMAETIARTAKPLRPFLLRAGAPIAATLLAALTLWLAAWEQSVEIAGLQSKIQQRRSATLEGKRLERLLAESSLRSTQLASLASTAPPSDSYRLFGQVAGCLPADLWIGEFATRGAKTVSIAGVSYSEQSVYELVKNLEAAPRFAAVALRATQPTATAEGPATRFEIDLQIAPGANP